MKSRVALFGVLSAFIISSGLSAEAEASNQHDTLVVRFTPKPGLFQQFLESVGIASTSETRFEFENIDNEKLQVFLTKRTHLLEDYSELEKHEFVKEMLQALENEPIKNVFDLSEFLVSWLYKNIEYDGKLGSKPPMIETWNLSEKRAICDSFSRIFEVLFDYMVQNHYPQFEPSFIRTISGMKHLSCIYNYSCGAAMGHAYNGVFHLEGSVLSVRLFDVTWNEVDVTEIRAVDIVYSLLMEKVISKAQAIDVLAKFTASEKIVGRIWAFSNLMLASMEGSSGELQTIQSIAEKISPEVQRLTDCELHHLLFEPLESYLLIGGEWWNHYHDKSLEQFVADLGRRSADIDAILEQMVSPDSRIEKFREKIKGFADIASLIQKQISDTQPKNEIMANLGLIFAEIEKNRLNKGMFEKFENSIPLAKNSSEVHDSL